MLLFSAALLGAFVLTGALIPLLRRALLDVPNHRSSHSSPTPRGGGLAVMLAVVLGLVLAPDFDAWPAVLAAVALAGIGLLDDVRSLSGGFRLLAQILTATSVGIWVQGATQMNSQWWWAPVVVLVLVGYVNAFNFMDGVNGISGLVTAVVGVFWLLVGNRGDLSSVEDMGLVLAGAALGFLPWNAPRARIFLGDVGSYGLGMMIGALSVFAWAQGVHWLLAIAPLVVYGADTTWVLMKRARGRRPLMQAHREHVYQRLVDGGWSHLASAGLTAGVSGLACVVAILTWQSIPALGVCIIGLLVAAYLGAPRALLSLGGETR